MKNKRKTKQTRGGFTLVELLAVIVILAIILVIAVPSISGIISKTKTDAYNAQVKMIEDAAKKYIIGAAPTLTEGVNEISLQTLVDEEYLDSNILDPRCNCAIDLTMSKVTITKTGDSLAYSSTIESGYTGAVVAPVITVSLASRTSTTITLDITDVQGTIDGYQYSLDGGEWTSLAADKTITGLTSASEYEVKVKAISGSVESAEVVNTIKTLYGNGAIVGNDPKIPIGAVPITRNAANTAWVVANLEAEWYNYATSKWANMVLINETSRNANKYIDTNGNFIVDTTVDEADVLAYYVWIPRYQYTIFSTKATTTPALPGGGIEIDFVGTNNTTRCADTGASECVIGDKLVHPAFKFGDDEVNGFWVGKFELTSDAASCTDNTTCLAKTPTIKPGIPSLRHLNVSELSSKINSFKTNPMYGINTDNNIDSHMLKNMEWGAVTYLAYSSYGRGTSEIWINPNSNYITGQVGSSVSAGGTTSTTSYDANPTASEGSTTRNIYGVYDMSGGANEYVMGVIKDNNSDNPMSGNSTANNSGYSGKVYADGAYTAFSGTLFPNVKDFDLYEYGTTWQDVAAYSRGKYGDATFETKGINGDSAYFAYAAGPWFVRGGYYSITTYAGPANFVYTFGNAYNGSSARPVLVKMGN